MWAVVALAVVVTGPPAVAAAAGARIACTVTDHRVVGLSGLVVTDNGYLSISDSNIDKGAIRVWFFDKKCQVTRSISYPTSAYDPEDMAIGRDGTIYVADIGDNHQERDSIAIWRIPPGSSRPHIYRYTYPDHPHDAEAMLLAADDTPIVITKDFGVGEIFVPTAPGDPSGRPVGLKRVGAFTPGRTKTPNFLGAFGSTLITGGANSRDRTRVALRTYADAYVWHVPDGNVVKAITTTTPSIVPLPDEAQGESIAFDPSGTHLYTVSDREVEPVKTPILAYALPVASASPPSVPIRARGVGTPGRASLPTDVVAVLAVLGLAALVGIGSGLIRARRRP
jgi:hypothetical protein